jgi:hypothetical protein
MARSDSILLVNSVLLRMFEIDGSVMFFDPCLNRTSSLSHILLSALARDAVYAWRFYGQVVVNVMKKAGELPQWESDGLDTMF